MVDTAVKCLFCLKKVNDSSKLAWSDGKNTGYFCKDCHSKASILSKKLEKYEKNPSICAKCGKKMSFLQDNGSGFQLMHIGTEDSSGETEYFCGDCVRKSKGKDKCSRCETTISKTFWTFKDGSMLCDSCHKKYGDEWQEGIVEGHYADTRKKPIKWSVAFYLSFFFGWLGVDRYMMGKIVTGLLKMFTLGGFGIWWLIDFILISFSYQFKGVRWIMPKNKPTHFAILGIFVVVIIILLSLT